MPATRLANPLVDLIEYDLVGQDDRAPFVRHLGLSAVSGSHARSAIPVYEMGPPLRSPGLMAVDVSGTANLDDNEKQKLKSFIDRHAGEHAARQLGRRKSYVIYPHLREEPEDDGTYSYTRFSCAGFVIEGYRSARIELIDLEQVPPVSLEFAAVAYPDIAQALKQSAWLRNEYGLNGTDPWPIIFCGYLLHAIARSPEQIRQSSYRPRISDVNFP